MLIETPNIFALLGSGPENPVTRIRNSNLRNCVKVTHKGENSTSDDKFHFHSLRINFKEMGLHKFC